MKLVRFTERSHRMALAAATVSVAVGVGFFVQSGAPTNASAVEEAPAKKIAPSLNSDAPLLVASAGALPALPSFDAGEATLPVQRVALEVSRDQPIGEMPTEETAPLLRCTPSVTASPAVAALVNLAISADCLPNAQVRISHAGLRFTEVLDEEGLLEISVPALQSDARFEVRFPNGSSLNSVTSVPSLQFYDRVALQWQGETGLQIHAREFGADYGAEGHVWFGNTRDLTAVIGGGGGFLLRLGDGLSEISQMADVYTFPTGSANTDGIVEISVEAEVNGSNCGRDIAANTLQFGQVGQTVTRELEIAMPECGATGDFLVLKNLLQDLTIAQK